MAAEGVRMRLLVCIATLAIALGGCANENSVPVPLTDKFAPQIVVKGPSRYDDPVLGIAKEWYLKSFVDKKTGYVTHQLYVSIAYVGAWKLFDTASNDQGRALPVRQVDPSVGNSCDVELCDALGVELSSAFLRARAGTGFEIKLSDDAGDSFILKISSDMVSKQLEVSAEQARVISSKG
jgi:hypothetical protein